MLYEVITFAEMRLSELAAGLEAGRWTSAELVEAYVAEIGRVDGTTNAIAELNPDAASIAADLDLERAAGRVRGPLHGIPVVAEDFRGRTSREPSAPERADTLRPSYNFV